MLQAYPFGDGMAVRVELDRIDAAEAMAFRDSLCALTRSGSGRVVLDLSQVRFVDSSGLGAIVGAMKQLPPGRSMELAGLHPAVERVFRLTRLDTIFHIHPKGAALAFPAPPVVNARAAGAGG